jgi:regulatory protein
MGPGNSHCAQGLAPRPFCVIDPRSGVIVSKASTYDQALRLLEFRARSVAELRRKLLQKGQEHDLVEATIAKLLDQGLLDDVDFAREFARTKVLGAGSSRRRIVMELTRKGVARGVADAAVEGLQESEGIDASAVIHRVAEKKWKSLAKLDDFTRKRRLYAFLARRGFNPDEIRGALDTLREGKDG